MKAVLLENVGRQPTLTEVDEPTAGPGEAVVRVLAAPVISYAREVFDGSRGYPLVTPLVPGCGAIGEVVSVGPDATRLKPGDRVFCDPTVRSRDNALTPDEMLHGWIAIGEGGHTLMRYFRNGPFAEQMMIPLENALLLGPASDIDPAQLCALNTLLVPFGGLVAAEMQAGETVLVNGATGHFGSAGVLVALAMSAARVVATARNENRLDALAQRLGPRVVPVALTGDENQDLEKVRLAAGGDVDRALDLLPPVKDTSAVRVAIRSIRPHGCASIMGGIQGDFTLPYSETMLKNIAIKGRFMYPRSAPRRLFAMVAAGLLELSSFDITRFALDDFDAATEHAANNSGAFEMTVLEP